MAETAREKVIRLIREMRNRTVDRGATPAEAAGFAAKVAEFIERYQIDEAELKAGNSGGAPTKPEDVEVCQNYLRTGAKVFNPGMTRIVSALARAMCCKVILLPAGYRRGYEDCTYGIVGDTLDADYVCQMATTLVPALRTMAKLEGAEHGYEKAGLVRWTNQYLTGAALEIERRIVAERRERSEVKRVEHKLLAAGGTGTVLTCITGESIAAIKHEAAAAAFKREYPKTRTTHSRAEYDRTAYERGREVGKTVGLNLGIE